MDGTTSATDGTLGMIVDGRPDPLGGLPRCPCRVRATSTGSDRRPVTSSRGDHARPAWCRRASATSFLLAASVSLSWRLRLRLVGSRLGVPFAASTRGLRLLSFVC